MAHNVTRGHRATRHAPASRREPLLAENFGEDTGGMLTRIDALVHTLDPALFVDEKAHARRMSRVKIRTRAVRESCRALAIAK